MLIRLKLLWGRAEAIPDWVLLIELEEKKRVNPKVSYSSPTELLLIIPNCPHVYHVTSLVSILLLTF